MASCAWLLALRPCEWNCIHLTFALRMVLPQAVASHFGNWLDFVSEVELESLLPSATLILVTGTKVFLARWGKKLPTTVSALSFFTAGRIDGGVTGWVFRSLSHAQVGGVTTVRFSMGFHGGTPWPTLPFAVKRRLSHILKYSERPTAVSWNKPTSHYQVPLPGDGFNFHPVVGASGAIPNIHGRWWMGGAKINSGRNLRCF
jgi:hypothetical protein